jgi:hypothetical protein
MYLVPLAFQIAATIYRGVQLKIKRVDDKRLSLGFVNDPFCFGAGLVGRLNGSFLYLHPFVKGLDQFAVNLREIDIFRRFFRKPELLDKTPHDCPPLPYISN